MVHLLNDQPVVADLLAPPSPDDMLLVCTNLRTLEGRRPVFIDAADSTFVFPYTGIRFVEIPSTDQSRVVPEAAAVQATPEPAAEPDELEIDEDFLRRVRDA